jgi:hypothetical protein
MRTDYKEIDRRRGLLPPQIQSLSLKKEGAPGDCCGGPVASSKHVRMERHQGNSSGWAFDSATRDATGSPGAREKSPFRTGRLSGDSAQLVCPSAPSPPHLKLVARRHFAAEPANPPNVFCMPGRKDTVTYWPPERCAFRSCKSQPQRGKRTSPGVLQIGFLRPEFRTARSGRPTRPHPWEKDKNSPKPATIPCERAGEGLLFLQSAVSAPSVPIPPGANERNEKQPPRRFRQIGPSEYRVRRSSSGTKPWSVKVEIQFT